MQVVDTYRIVRFYFNRNLRCRERTLKTGLTIEQAVAHCEDPQTSSSTCTSKCGKHRTKMLGPWFEGFVKEV